MTDLLNTVNVLYYYCFIYRLTMGGRLEGPLFRIHKDVVQQVGTVLCV